MIETILLSILGLSIIAIGLTYVLPRKKFFYVPTILLFGIGIIMIGISFIPGIKGNWLDVILVIFGMIFIFAALLTSLTIIFMKYSAKRRG
ncbi:MAG: hypothetical protein RBT45_04385 [Acholeplasmataceae bacterium]|jgi:hypothetical protein|nr:hypothetical protein [Acholeplasmataceae bacterium]